MRCRAILGACESPAVAVVCAVCGINFDISARNERQHRREGAPFVCRRCRGGAGPTRAQVEATKRWWLDATRSRSCSGGRQSSRRRGARYVAAPTAESESHGWSRHGRTRSPLRVLLDELEEVGNADQRPEVAWKHDDGQLTEDGVDVAAREAELVRIGVANERVGVREPLADCRDAASRADRRLVGPWRRVWRCWPPAGASAERLSRGRPRAIRVPRRRPPELHRLGSHRSLVSESCDGLPRLGAALRELRRECRRGLALPPPATSSRPPRRAGGAASRTRRSGVSPARAPNNCPLYLRMAVARHDPDTRGGQHALRNASVPDR
jgi:hypothetical protein